MNLIVLGFRAGSQSSKLTRLEAEIAAMQRNSGTYWEEPPASPAYSAWLQSFDLDAHVDEIEQITQENAFMSELQVQPHHESSCSSCRLGRLGVAGIFGSSGSKPTWLSPVQ